MTASALYILAALILIAPHADELTAKRVSDFRD